MLWAFYWIQIAFALLGLFLLWHGLRGRVLDDHPHCRRCGYDLFGLATAGRVCPECGADLRGRRAVLVGASRRRWGLVVVAALCGAAAYGLGPLRHQVYRQWVMKPTAFVHAVRYADEVMVEDLLTSDPRLIKLRPRGGQTLLDLAVTSSRPERVLMRLLAAGADPNEVGSGNGYRPLHRAAWEGKPGAVQVLLAGGADPNVKDGNGETPLHFAARGPSGLATSRMLFASKADPNARDGSGATPLHSAAAGTDPAVVRALLAGGAKVNAANEQGRTPLHVAMAARNWETSLTLVREGADLAARDRAGKLPAQLAREVSDPGGQQFVAMVYHGALSHRSANDRLEDVRGALKADPAALKDVGPDGPLLHVAVALRQTDLAKVMLECGADPNQRDAEGRTALHRACWGHDPPTVSLLLASKADANARDKHGRTPLHVAADSPALSRTAELLLDHGADPGARDDDGLTPLEYAATSPQDNRPEFIRTLLARGAATNVFAAVALGDEPAVRAMLDRDAGLASGGAGFHRMLPLQVAAWHGHADVARLLLDRGADPNAGAGAAGTGTTMPTTAPTTAPKTASTTASTTAPAATRTPLFDAIGRREVEVARLLIERGARVNARNGAGVMPLHVATLSGVGEPGVRLLLAHGADPDARDPAGQTPLHLAAGYCALGTVRAVLDAGADPRAKDHAGLTPRDHAVRINLSRPEVAELLAKAASETPASRPTRSPPQPPSPP